MRVGIGESTLGRADGDGHQHGLATAASASTYARISTRTFAQVNTGITYVALSVVLGAVYAGAVLVIGAFAGRGSAWATAGATLLAAAVFKLLHRRVQARVDCRFRSARHDALSRVEAFVDALRSDQAEPEQLVEVLRAALDDPALELRFVLQPDEPPVDERGRPADTAVTANHECVDIERGGVVLGQLVWLPLSNERRALLPSVIDAAGLAIEMARLRVELRRRLAEVEASRARIAAVADEERRRIERDLAGLEARTTGRVHRGPDRPAFVIAFC